MVQLSLSDPSNKIIKVNRPLRNALFVRKMPQTNAIIMEKLPMTVKGLLPKIKGINMGPLLNSKEVTIKKAPLNNSLTIRKDLLKSSKINHNVRNTSNLRPVGSTSTVISPPSPFTAKDRSRMSCITLLKNTTLCPFKYNRGSFQCLYCNAEFLDVHQVEEHVTQHDSISEDEIYKVLVRKSVNELTKLNVKEYGCKICGDLLENWDVLKQHLVEKHERKIDPNNDGVVLYKINKNNFDCAHCDKKFVKYRLLNIHIKEHYMKYFCDQCGTGFITPTGLRHHMKSHESGSYPCAVCGKVYKNKTGREEHHRSVHARARKNVCNICREGFIGYYQKLRHMKDVHNADIPEYKCTFCPKVFLMHSYWKNHEKITHLKSACYTCDICEYKHHNKASLKRHMIVHSSEKLHKCNVCGKAYARRSTLREHMRIHNNDRRFMCNYCDRAFVQKCSLKGHMKTHHKDVVFN